MVVSVRTHPRRTSVLSHWAAGASPGLEKMPALCLAAPRTVTALVCRVDDQQGCTGIWVPVISFFFSLSLLSQAPADAISVVSYTRRARARGIVGEEGFRMNMLVVPGKTATDPGGQRHTFRAKAKTAVYGGGNAVPAVLFFSFFGRRRRPSRLQPCACPQPDASTRWR